MTSVTSVTPPLPAKAEIGTLPLAQGGSSGVEKKGDLREPSHASPTVQHPLRAFAVLQRGVCSSGSAARPGEERNAALHPARRAKPARPSRQTCLPAATDRRRRSPILPAPSSTPSQPRSQPRSAFFLSPPAHPTAPCHRSLLAPSRHSPAAVWCHAPTSAHTRLSVRSGGLQGH